MLILFCPNRLRYKVRQQNDLPATLIRRPLGARRVGANHPNVMSADPLELGVLDQSFHPPTTWSSACWNKPCKKDIVSDCISADPLALGVLDQTFVIR